jgi:hypothetical protein
MHFCCILLHPFALRVLSIRVAKYEAISGILWQSTAGTGEASGCKVFQQLNQATIIF